VATVAGTSAENRFATNVLIGLLLGSFCIGNTQAQNDDSVIWGAELEYRSRYLFAGFPISDGPVMQATLDASVGGLLLTAYTNYDKDDSEINEADIFADYYFSYSDTISLRLGAGILNFKHARVAGQWDSTYEFYAGFVSSLPGNPELNYVRDFSLSDGGETLTLSLSHQIAVGGVQLIGSGNLVYNDQYYRSESNLSHFDLSLAVKATVGSFSLLPKISFQRGIADDFEDYWVCALAIRRDF
jgi:hypothetical protein